MKKIALALIVKGSDEEAKFLDQCLFNVSEYVPDIFITSTYKKGSKPNEAVEEVCKRYNAHVSYFEWVDDFSKARNFNFSQVPKDYEYIMWIDADDRVRGLEKLQDLLKENEDVDAFAFNYLYAFDAYKNPTVVHKKTQIVRNDGCVEWVGRLHEDFKENRQLNVKFVSFIERMHFTNDDHVAEAVERNVQISKKELKDNPNDPRNNFNYGNSLFQASDFKEAKKQYLKFLETSGSDDEKYIVYQRLSSCEKMLGNKEMAVQNLHIAIGLMPDLPEAYNNLGYLYFDYDLLDQAEKYLLIGLVTKPKYHKMIVYNPRDYDYNPMMALAQVYFKKSRPDLALPMLKGCQKIYPNDKYIGGLVDEMEKENERLTKVLDASKHIETLDGNIEKIRYVIEKLPEDLQSHPHICRLRNKYFIKSESSGKDITYYCGQTSHEWNPEMAKTKGIGGSEEAVINLSKNWAQLGYNVTVYNSCGIKEMVCDGVTYKPFWAYNPNDKTDITIAWRHPRLADYDINTGKLFIDLHDVVPSGEFTEKRLKKINKVFVKTNFHRSLFPNIPDEKIAIIPNGQDFETLTGDIKKDPMLIINTSSPDRSMDVMPKLFAEVKKQVPGAKMKYAYGFDIFDNAYKNDKVKQEWKNKCLKEMEEVGIENLGRISQAEVGKLYQEGRILGYASQFAEIDCISVKKAQACGCVPVTSDFGAFGESNKYGVKIPVNITKDNWSQPYQFTFGIKEEKAQKEWVDAVVKILKIPMGNEMYQKSIEAMKSFAEQFNWKRISYWWVDETFNPYKRELQTNE